MDKVKFSDLQNKGEYKVLIPIEVNGEETYVYVRNLLSSEVDDVLSLVSEYQMVEGLEDEMPDESHIYLELMKKFTNIEVDADYDPNVVDPILDRVFSGLREIVHEAFVRKSFIDMAEIESAIELEIGKRKLEKLSEASLYMKLDEEENTDKDGEN